MFQISRNAKISKDSKNKVYHMFEIKLFGGNEKTTTIICFETLGGIIEKIVYLLNQFVYADWIFYEWMSKDVVTTNLSGFIFILELSIL